MSKATEYIPDFSESNRDLSELVALSLRHRFDLFEYLRLLSEAGAPSICCEVDSSTAGSAGSRIVRYKLSEGLLVILAALRARNLNHDEIRGSARSGGAVSSAASSLGRQAHHQTSTQVDENQR